MLRTTSGWKMSAATVAARADRASVIMAGFFLIISQRVKAGTTSSQGVILKRDESISEYVSIWTSGTLP